MANKRKTTQPEEITATDLEQRQRRGPATRPAADIFAVGTPGGGAAAGGLAGTNIGDGDPDNADLENAMGDGIFDTDGDDEPANGS